MNANELADKLEYRYEQDCEDGLDDLILKNSATMLRQQQAEIEALRMMLANRNDALDRLDLK